MSASLVELLDLLARWIHVLAGIMWIGNSLLFNWLDRNLRPSSRSAGDGASTQHNRVAIVAGAADAAAPAPPTGMLGEIWLLHSGAFYFVEKTLLSGQQLPRPLHWFKWQAYTTWLSGMALLLVVYYLGGRAVLADTSVAPLTHVQAAEVGLAAIFGGWLLYESMQRFVAPRAPALALAVWLTGLTAIAIELTRLLNGRAAFLHVGAMLGTIMAANVFFTIVPSQREMVTSMAEGRDASPAVSSRAKRVSIHNNYFTFPVVVLMLSNHFPAVYGGRYSWLLLLVLIAAGAAVRHVLNIRFRLPEWRPVLAGTIAASLLALFGLLRAGTTPVAATAETAAAATRNASAPVLFSEARHVIDRRCGACHSAQPSDLSFGGVAPAGVTFDTPEQIVAHAGRINERAVVTRTMPLGNKTNMTDAERALLGRWIAQGARLH